jgi:hypothetical protein
MANPTTNFGWQMPTASDLVTDLPADFEVFGQAVDTALVDLKGGTTGQVLSKASNTNMDFTWVTTDDANAIQNSIVDAKGDLIAASAADTPARLAVGNNGETLVADSSTSTGLRYQAPVAANPVINSAFQVWQRGTSISVPASTTAFTTDRFMLEARPSQACTVSRQVTNDTTNLPFIQYCARIQRNSGQTGTSTNYFTTSFETVNSIPFVGKTVTLSFYARKGADYSATSSILVSNVASGTGTDQNISVSYTGNTDQTQNNTLTANWQRFSQTVTIASSKTEIALGFSWTPVGTAGTNDYYEITGIQLEVGSVATQFKTNGATFQGELAACQRYFYRTSVISGNVGFSNGMAQNTTSSFFNFWGVTMRNTPTGTINGALQTICGNSAAAISSINAIYWSANNQNTTVNFVSGSLTATGAVMFYAATSGVSFDLSAEL